jgi:3,4-dihydroxy 2-butanone 4-phosphate synthase/GTP cyclohydrolase II
LDAAAGLANALGLDPDTPFLAALLAHLPPDGPPAGAPDDVVGRVRLAIEAVRRGEPVLVVDDVDRENEGDLVVAAQHATTERVAFLLRHTSGVLCCALTPERADELGLPLMVARGDEAMGTAFTVTVDARHGTTTGISAADRSTTLRALADRATTTADLTRPGHVFPLRAKPMGVLERSGHTEAAVDLVRLAGLAPAAVIGEVVTEDHAAMARRPELARLAERHRLVMITIDDLVRYRRRTERLVARESSARIPSPWGRLTCHTYRSVVTGAEHAAFVLGDPSATPGPVLCRVHSECLTGDLFGSLRCDCGEQLRAAMDAIAEQGSGVFVYVRGHEGRAIGLAAKMSAYRLQDEGLDTVDANLALGLPADARDYDDAAQILLDLGLRSVELMTNNPDKQLALLEHGLIATRRPVAMAATPDNAAYLETKRVRLGHLLPRHLR